MESENVVFFSNNNIHFSRDYFFHSMLNHGGVGSGVLRNLHGAPGSLSFDIAVSQPNSF